MRALLGVGEAGNFPGAAKAVSEWFPAKERAVATGIFNIGAGLGAAVAPPLIGFLIIKFGWQAAFIATGAIGFLWIAMWLAFYRTPEEHPWISPEELRYIREGQAKTSEAEEKVTASPWREALASRDLWALIAARFLTDPVWLFFALWLPKYFKTARGFDIKEIALFVWIPFLAADIGSVVGGAVSGYFIKRGWPVLKARKTAMLLSAALMPMSIPAVMVGSWQWALVFLCLPTFAHQSWAASLLTLPSDLFPRRMVATAYGLTGTLGILGAAVLQIVIGRVVDVSSYTPIFIAAGFMHPIGALIVWSVVGREKTPAQACA